MPSVQSQAGPASAAGELSSPGDGAGHPFRTGLEILLLAGLYAALARLGQLTAIPPGNITAVYPPAGLAIAFILLRGRRIWPAIWLGEFLGNSWAFFDPSTTALWLRTGLAGGLLGAGAVAQALGGAFLILRWTQIRYPFETVRGVFRFAASAFVACILSASIGVGTLFLVGLVDGGRVAYTWWTWYMGDTAGYIVVGSALLALAHRPGLRWTGRSLEAAALLAVATLAGASVFAGNVFPGGHNLPLVFLPLPLIVWGAVRFDQRAVSLVVMIIGSAVLTATALEMGPFTTGDTNQSLVFLALFIGVYQISGLSMRAAFAQRFRAEADLAQLNRSMEDTIRRRTAQLEEQRRFLRQIIDVDPNFIFAKDREGRFTLVNQAVAEAYGTTVDDLIGRHDSDFNPNPDEVARFLRDDLEVMDTLREKRISEESITDSEGKVRWLQTVKRPLVGSSGRADQVLGSATDITERKGIEERLRRSEVTLRHKQGELQELTRRLLTAQEDEKRRLARHLHDDLTQWLAATSLHAGRLERLIPDPSPEVLDLLGHLKIELGRLSTDVHALSRRLHPSILDDLGLVDALSSECDLWSEQEGISARFTAGKNLVEPTRDVALCIYRIAQEALRNVAKHSHSPSVEISLDGSADGTTLTVADEGQGFDPAERPTAGGIGLVSMAERARMIDGVLSVESSPGEGTIVRLSVPAPVPDPG